VWNGMTAILARVERHGNVTLGSLLKEPDFGWGPTMLACWQAVLGGRRDEALSLFGAIGVDGPMRIRAMQAFLIECRIRQIMSVLPKGTSVSPALDCLPAESWELILREWAEWSREHAFEVERSDRTSPRLLGCCEDLRAMESNILLAVTRGDCSLRRSSTAHQNTHLSMLLKRRDFADWDAIPSGILGSVARVRR